MSSSSVKLRCADRSSRVAGTAMCRRCVSGGQRGQPARAIAEREKVRCRQRIVPPAPGVVD